MRSKAVNHQPDHLCDISSKTSRNTLLSSLPEQFDLALLIHSLLLQSASTSGLFIEHKMPLYKCDQPVPRLRSEASQQETEFSIPGEPKKPFADLQLAYTSCKDAILPLQFSEDHSIECQSWLGMINKRLADIHRLRQKAGGSSRVFDPDSSFVVAFSHRTAVGQIATQATVLSRPDARFDSRNAHRMVMKQQVRRLRHLCSGVLVEVARCPDHPRDCNTYDNDNISRTLREAYTVYVDAYDKLCHQQWMSFVEREDVNPKTREPRKIRIRRQVND